MSPPSPAWRRRKNRPRRASYPKDGCIRPPLQGAGPRKGFVARQGRPEARRASAGASAEAYGSVRRTSERRARPTQPGDRLSQQKRQPFGRPAPAARSAPPALCRTPCARLGVPEVRLRRARSSFAVWRRIRIASAADPSGDRPLAPASLHSLAQRGTLLGYSPRKSGVSPAILGRAPRRERRIDVLGASPSL